MVDDGVRGIVLDLRSNPGGLLEEAVAVASVFIEDGEIVSVEERARERETLDAVDDAFEQVPLAVLVDGSSASASEIVAGAVQDAGRAPIVGEQTFGKGTVQTIAQLSDGSGVKFTTARYFTPSGDSIEGVGVMPDVPVKPGDAGELADDPQVRAAIERIAEQAGGQG
jgi:carboxyl-terminal processing protease